MKLSRGNVVGPGGRVGQFWTPGWCARAFARWCGLRSGVRVLDCGSGMGALSLAAAETGAKVRAVETDERLVERTRPMLERTGVVLVHQDFLAPLAHPHRGRQTSIETGYASDVAIANPPWEGDYPERFFLRQLELAPRAAQILPLNFLSGVERSPFWRLVEIVRVRVLPRRPKFDAGKNANGMRDVMFIELRLRARPRQPFDVDHAEIGVGE